MFNKEKMYSQREVDEMIAKLKNDNQASIASLRAQNAELKQAVESQNQKNLGLVANEDKIKEALLHAIEKAKSIEQEGKKFYEAQLERVKMLYNKWVQIIDEVKTKYGIIDTNELNAQKFAGEIEEFLTTTINVEIKHQSPVLENIKIVGADEKYYHKQLLTRMSGLMTSVSARLKDEQTVKPEIVVPLPRIPTKENVVIKQQFESETKRLENIIEKPVQPKPANTYATVMQRYVKDEKDDVLDVSYAKKIVQETTETKSESGFDLKEALNPRESLEDILKEFNF